MKGSRVALILLAVGWAPLGVAAEEAVLQNGRTLRIDAWRREADTIWLTLSGGGEMSVPADRLREVRPCPPEEGVVPPAVAATAVAPPVAEPEPAPAGEPGLDLDQCIEEAARKHGVSPRLLRAVIEAESGWNPRAVSPKGAAGLMQLMPGTARARGVSDPFDPAQNVEAGAAELATQLRAHSGELAMALAAYNAGGRAVARYDGIPPYRETLGYVRRVLDRYFTAGNLPPLPPPAR